MDVHYIRSTDRQLFIEKDTLLQLQAGDLEDKNWK